MLHDLVPLVGLAFEPQQPHKSSSVDKVKRTSSSPSPSRCPPGIAWFPVESSTPTSSSATPISFSHRSALNPETPAFEPLSPPEDDSSSLKPLQTSPNRRRTLELPPSPPDSPPRISHESLLSYSRPKNKACRGRAPTRSSSDSRTRSNTAVRRPRAPTSSCRAPPVVTLPSSPEPDTIFEEEEPETSVDDEDDDRFLSLPLLRLRHRLSVSLTLSSYPVPEEQTSSLTSLPNERSTSPTHRRRRAFPPGTVWAEQSHYRLYALQRSKAGRTAGGVGYWKRWEGIDLE